MGTVAGAANLLLGFLIAGVWGARPRQLLAALAIGGLGYGASVTLWVIRPAGPRCCLGSADLRRGALIGAGVAWIVLGESVSAALLLSIPLAVSGVALSLETDQETTELLHMHHWHQHGVDRVSAATELGLLSVGSARRGASHDGDRCAPSQPHVRSGALYVETS